MKNKQSYREFNDVLQKEQQDADVTQQQHKKTVQPRTSPRTATKFKKNNYSNNMYLSTENKIKNPVCHFRSSNLNTIERWLHVQMQLVS